MTSLDLAYHVSTLDCRGEILESGLAPTEQEGDEPDGVYLWRDQEIAKRETDLEEGEEVMDLFEVDVAGYRLREDKTLEGAWIAPNSIPSSKIKHLGTFRPAKHG